MDRDYSVLLTAPGGGSVRDITQLIRDITWQGNISKVPREWGATLALDKRDSASLPDLSEGCQITMQVDGKPIYTGVLHSVTTDSQSVLGDITSMDRGWYLAQNEGWYRFDGTPAEEIAATVCGDFGIPVGKLAATGAKVKRKFPGVTLLQIIGTAYTMAGADNGKRYLMRFSGDGALDVIEKPEVASLEIRVTQAVTITWDISKLQNAVKIVTDTGAEVTVVSDAESVKRNGTLQHIIQQSSGQDSQAEAEAWIKDHGLQQTLTVEVPGDIRLITGEAVLLRDTGSGVSGLFWIDSDTHTWKNGLHKTKLKLNFQNIVNEMSAGSEG